MTEVEEATVGYGLDLRGDCFVKETDGDFDTYLVYESPSYADIHDLFPWVGAVERESHSLLYVFVLEYEVEWPDIVFRNLTWSLYSHGTVHDSDRECVCHGRTTSDGTWEATGNTADEPYLACSRCDGHGTVSSPGGRWALYALL